MELKHEFAVPASVEATWAAFNDPAQVAPCFPGATLISVDGDEFTGAAKIKLGPISLQYNGVGRYVERDESAHRAVIEAKGKDKRGNGTANATVTAQMRPDGEGTAIQVTTDLAVTGKPAQFGRGVMQDVSDKLLEQFVACLQIRLGGPEAGAAAHAGGAAGAQGAAQAEQAPAAGAPAEQVEAAPAPAPPVTAAVPGASTMASATTLPSAPTPTSASGADVELNLLTTVGRVLLTRYAARALGPVALVVGYLLGRRSRR